MSPPLPNRRHFLGTTALGAAAFAFGQDQPATLPPSERLNIACIGVGGQGNYDIRVPAHFGHNIVALCDADYRMAADAFEKHPKAARYQDYRILFDKEAANIDAVIVATLDHHHAPATLAAIDLGKHVYCEKPLTHSVWEARRVAEAAREKGVATQMGNTGAASDGVRTLCELVWAGAIGPVREVHAWTDRPIWPQGIETPEEAMQPHAKLDWDLWLGPAPARAYHTIYHPFDWRGWWDFGTGALGDMGCHRLDATFKALKLGAPEYVEATQAKGERDSGNDSFPLASIIRYHFPARSEMPPVKLYWYDGGLLPERPEGMPDDHAFNDNGVLFIGDNGILLNGRLVPESRHTTYAMPPETLPRSIGHWEEWFAACKGEDVTPGSNFDIAGPLTEAVLLGNVALHTNNPIHWDGANLRVTNHDEANALIKRDYRADWL